jgi:hypothetical protein
MIDRPGKLELVWMGTSYLQPWLLRANARKNSGRLIAGHLLGYGLLGSLSAAIPTPRQHLERRKTVRDVRPAIDLWDARRVRRRR